MHVICLPLGRESFAPFRIYLRRISFSRSRNGSVCRRFGLATLPQELQRLYDRVADLIAPLGSVAVAFSAGVDSALVLAVARRVLGKGNVVAVTGRSASVPSDDLAEAPRLAALLDVEHVFLDTDEFNKSDYLSNPINRCYFCKDTLYTHLHRFAAGRGISAIVNGTNADDLGDHRPGLLAATEHDVHAPLAEAGLTKGDVRALSEALDLPTFDKPAAPCLSSRVPYGINITPEKLRMIESAERLLHELGIRECRVRHHEGMARIEVSPAHFERIIDPATARRIDEHFRGLGYAFVTLDLRGFRSGSLNEGVRESSASSRGAGFEGGQNERAAESRQGSIRLPISG